MFLVDCPPWRLSCNFPAFMIQLSVTLKLNGSAQTSFSTCGLLGQGRLGPTALKEVGPAGSQSPQASGVSSAAVAIADGRKEVI